MSRSDLEHLMWEAWRTVWPKLQADPDELRARLARRRSKTYLKPMRATCLAVRASDRRINSWDAITIPDDACHLGRPDLYRQHIVSVDKRLLLAVCAPIDVNNWGETAKDLASRMGCPKTFVRHLRKSGTLRVRYRMDRTFTYPRAARRIPEKPRHPPLRLSPGPQRLRQTTARPDLRPAVELVRPVPAG